MIEKYLHYTVNHLQRCVQAKLFKTIMAVQTELFYICKMGHYNKENYCESGRGCWKPDGLVEDIASKYESQMQDYIDALLQSTRKCGLGLSDVSPMNDTDILASGKSEGRGICILYNK